MKIALLTNIISPHQLPLAQALRKRVGGANYRYIYTESLHGERASMGWGDAVDDSWCRQGDEVNDAVTEADVIYSESRATSLFQQRNREHKISFYTSERWFKPPLGFLRVFVLPYFLKIFAFLRCFRNPKTCFLPQGIHAARDMVRILGLLKGDLRFLFRAPTVAFESRPGGIVVPLKTAVEAGVLSADDIAFAKRQGFVRISEGHWDKVTPTDLYAKMRLWGYFVAPSTQPKMPAPKPDGEPLKVLWVGRMLALKHVDTLIAAVKSCITVYNMNVTLDLYGHGPMEAVLKDLAEGYDGIRFHDFIPIQEVRSVMRAHDVYVFPSNGYDGWGAVVSEALEEGLCVFGSYEAGATATMLDKKHLFAAEDVNGLVNLLKHYSPECNTIRTWNADDAADAMLQLIEEIQK